MEDTNDFWPRTGDHSIRWEKGYVDPFNQMMRLGSPTACHYGCFGPKWRPCFEMHEFQSHFQIGEIPTAHSLAGIMVFLELIKELGNDTHGSLDRLLAAQFQLQIYECSDSRTYEIHVVGCNSNLTGESSNLFRYLRCLPRSPQRRQFSRKDWR